MATTVGAQALETVVWDGLEDMREALRAFLGRHCPDENDVEDVIQETFLRAARYRRRRRIQSLRPWAMRIALNVLADVRRRGSRGLVTEADEVFDPPDRETPEHEGAGFRVGRAWLDAEVASELLRSTLERLRSSDRRLLASFYGGPRRSSVTGAECGIPRRLVKVRLYRARQRLRVALHAEAMRAPCRRLLAS